MFYFHRLNTNVLLGSHQISYVLYLRVYQYETINKIKNLKKKKLKSQESAVRQNYIKRKDKTE